MALNPKVVFEGFGNYSATSYTFACCNRGKNSYKNGRQIAVELPEREVSGRTK